MAKVEDPDEADDDENAKSVRLEFNPNLRTYLIRLKRSGIVGGNSLTSVVRALVNEGIQDKIGKGLLKPLDME